MKNILKINHLILSLFCFLFMTSCSKDDYYQDGGIAQAEFDGSILAYLETKPVLFDSIVQVIKLAGLEETLQQEEFTFFAPSDPDIKDLIGESRRYGLNSTLFYNGLDTIENLADIDSTIWRKHLLKYMFPGKNKLENYPQIDFSLRNTYPGQNYISHSGNVSNIGVVYNDVVQYDGSGNEIARLKYKGYRQLYLTYYPDESDPDFYRSYPVSTSDIQPTNGVIHVLNYIMTSFGLDNDNSSEFVNDVVQSKR